MTRQWTSRWSAAALGILSLAITTASADSPVPTAQKATSPEESIVKTLHANPVTSPYAFTVKAVGDQFALSGRVGSRRVHDVAIRSTIALGYPVRDDLIIDRAKPIASRLNPAIIPRGLASHPSTRLLFSAESTTRFSGLSLPS